MVSLTRSSANTSDNDLSLKDRCVRICVRVRFIPDKLKRLLPRPDAVNRTHQNHPEPHIQDQRLTGGFIAFAGLAHQRLENSSVSAPENFGVHEVGVIVGERHLDPFGRSARLREAEEFLQVFGIEGWDVKVYDRGCDVVGDGHEGLRFVVAIDDEILKLCFLWLLPFSVHVFADSDG